MALMIISQLYFCISYCDSLVTDLADFGQKSPRMKIVEKFVENLNYSESFKENIIEPI